MPLPPFPSLTTPGAVLKGRWTANAGVPGNGVNVTTWSDQSGNGKDLTAGTAPTFYAQRWAQGRPLTEWLNQQLTVSASGSYFSFLCDGSAFTVFVVWRTRQENPNAIYTLIDTGGSNGALKGLLLAYKNDTVADALLLQVANGSTQIVNSHIDGVVPYRRCHCTALTFDGSTYTLYEWGASVGTIAAGAGYATPGGVLNVGENIGSANALNGDIAEIIIIGGANLNAADFNAVTAYLECVWHVAGNWTSEYFPDGSVTGAKNQTNVYAVSGLNFAVNLPTKFSGNPILTGLQQTGKPDWDLIQGDVNQFGATDWRAWMEVQSNSTSDRNTGYYTSTDGINWTRPNLGLVTYSGNTNNNLVPPAAYTAANATYNSNGVAGQQYLLGSSTAGTTTYFELLGASDGKNFTILKNFGFGSSDIDGGSLMVRFDGRLANVGETETGPRQTSMIISDTNDVTSTWGAIQHNIIKAVDNTHQPYTPNVQMLGTNWINFLSIYSDIPSGGSGHVWIDLYHSRDEGWSYIACQTLQANGAAYLGNGASGQWDSGMIFGANFPYITPTSQWPANTWQLYYEGMTALHNDSAPYNASLGYATIPAGRLASLSGFGSVTLRAVYSPGSFPTVNARANGFRVTGACLDASGNVIAGYDDSLSTVVSTDSLGTTVSWAGKGLPAQVTRLRFTLGH